MVGALIRRLHLSRTDVEVVLGGGTLQNGNGLVLERVTTGIVAHTPHARVRVLRVAPVFGAMVEAFDRTGADLARLSPLKELLVPTPTD